MSAKRIAKDALLTAVALILFTVENLFPPLLAFAPGAKIGLSNAAVLITLIIIGVPDAFAVLTLKCVLGALVTGNMFSLAYSLPSSLTSLCVQPALYKTLFPKISLMAVSLSGATVFNIVQLFVASLIAHANMLPLLPLMLIASAAAGLLIGAAVFFTVRLLPSAVIETANEKEKQKEEVTSQ